MRKQKEESTVKVVVPQDHPTPKPTKEATIKATFKEVPYREGSARQELLLKAAKAGTVEKFLKAAGTPSGGTARSYLAMFIREGHVKVGA